MSAPSAVEDVFLAALEKGTPEERAAYLNAACQDDPDLRRRVERLLEAHPGAEQFLEVRTVPPRQGTAAYVPIGEQVGAVIAGRYKLVEEIGEGGMGTRLDGPADRAGQAGRRGQAHQGRHGLRRRCSPGSRPSGRPWR